MRLPVMVRLTVDLIERSPQFVNPLKKRELDVRGNKIPLIENLGATEDQFDAIDFSDNEITQLDNFPMLKRLQTIMASNNAISRIGSGLTTSIGAVHTLILSNNRLTNLGDLVNLAELPQLATLSLLKNPVTRKEHYRAFVINLLPKLRLLDFQLVKEKERKEATRFFKSDEGKAVVESARPSTEEEAASAAASDRQNPARVAAPIQKKKALSSAMVSKIQQAIESASSLEEIHQLEAALKAGTLPPELLGK
eukprot:SAG25_NODE_35_length_20155_cov_35.583815_4_plen_252_part_00